MTICEGKKYPTFGSKQSSFGIRDEQKIEKREQQQIQRCIADESVEETTVITDKHST